MVVGNDWKLVSNFLCEEVLIANILDAETGKFRWLCLDPETGRCATLPTEGGINVTPVFDHKRHQIIYLIPTGITSFQLSTREERLLIPIDWESCQTSRLWLSPQEPPTIYYLRGEREEPLARTLDRFDLTGVAESTNLRYGLFALQLGHNSPRLVTWFESWPVSFDVDWKHEVMVALVGMKRIKQLVVIDLRSNKLATVRTTEGVSAVAITPQLNVMKWGSCSPKMVETLPDGQNVILTDVWRVPSFSTDGFRLSVAIDDCEIWFKDAGQETPELVIELPKIFTQHRCDTPTWCQCGKHFAVCLAGLKSRDQNDRIIVIVNCATKEIVAVEGFSLPSSERVWVPRSTVTDYPYAVYGARG